MINVIITFNSMQSSRKL